MKIEIGIKAYLFGGCKIYMTEVIHGDFYDICDLRSVTNHDLYKLLSMDFNHFLRLFLFRMPILHWRVYSCYKFIQTDNAIYITLTKRICFYLNCLNNTLFSWWYLYNWSPCLVLYSKSPINNLCLWKFEVHSTHCKFWILNMIISIEIIQWSCKNSISNGWSSSRGNKTAKYEIDFFSYLAIFIFYFLCL